MRECKKVGCKKPTTDEYCSYRCREAASHAAAHNRSRVINNRANSRRF